MDWFYISVDLLIDITDVLNAVFHDFLKKALDNVPKYLHICSDNAGSYVEFQGDHLQRK